MSLVTFNTVRYFTATDVFHYTVDNRPLQDLASNDVLLQAAIDSNYAAIVRNQNKLITVVSSSVTAPAGNSVTMFYNQPLTANATITAETSPVVGDVLRIVRSSAATGAYNVTFNGKNLTASGTSITWQYDGVNWQEISYSTLI